MMLGEKIFSEEDIFFIFSEEDILTKADNLFNLDGKF
jgi:hypothetical protein